MNKTTDYVHIDDGDMNGSALSPQDDLGLTWIKDLKCPTCGGKSLYVGKGGYVTCSYIPCPEPDYEKGLQSYLDTKVREAEYHGQLQALGSFHDQGVIGGLSYAESVKQIYARLEELTQEQTR